MKRTTKKKASFVRLISHSCAHSRSRLVGSFSINNEEPQKCLNFEDLSSAHENFPILVIKNPSLIDFD